MVSIGLPPPKQWPKWGVRFAVRDAQVRIHVRSEWEHFFNQMPRVERNPRFFVR